MDVFNNMKAILAHIDDIKGVLEIRTIAPVKYMVIGKQPDDVYELTLIMLGLIQQISDCTKSGKVKVPDPPSKVEPRHCFANTQRIIAQLVRIKRRLGAPDHAIPIKIEQKVSPCHVYGEADIIIAELQLILDSLTNKKTAVA